MEERPIPMPGLIYKISLGPLGQLPGRSRQAAQRPKQASGDFKINNMLIIPTTAKFILQPGGQNHLSCGIGQFPDKIAFLHWTCSERFVANYYGYISVIYILVQKCVFKCEKRVRFIRHNYKQPGSLRPLSCRPRKRTHANHKTLGLLEWHQVEPKW